MTWQNSMTLLYCKGGGNPSQASWISIGLNYIILTSLLYRWLIYITILNWSDRSYSGRPTLLSIILFLDTFGLWKQILRYALKQEFLNSGIIKNQKGAY